jgi:hypothetical protein
MRGFLFGDFLRFKLVTSDHRVAGSSPAGCKSSSRANWRTLLELTAQQFPSLYCLNTALILKNDIES